MLESAAFATMTVFAGWMGTVPLAAFQSAFSLLSLPFMLALGFSTAASVRVASALAQDRLSDARRAGITATALCGMALAPQDIAIPCKREFYELRRLNKKGVYGLAVSVKQKRYP